MFHVKHRWSKILPSKVYIVKRMWKRRILFDDREKYTVWIKEDYAMKRKSYTTFAAIHLGS